MRSIATCTVSCVLLATFFLLLSPSSSLYRFQLLFETKTVITKLEEAPLTVGKSFGSGRVDKSDTSVAVVSLSLWRDWLI